MRRVIVIDILGLGTPIIPPFIKVTISRPNLSKSMPSLLEKLDHCGGMVFNRASSPLVSIVKHIKHQIQFFIGSMQQVRSGEMGSIGMTTAIAA